MNSNVNKMSTLTSPLNSFLLLAGAPITAAPNTSIEVSNTATKGIYYGNSSGAQTPLTFTYPPGYSNTMTLKAFDSQETVAAKASIDNLKNTILAIQYDTILDDSYTYVTVTISPGVSGNFNAVNFNNTVIQFNANNNPNAKFYMISLNEFNFNSGSSIELINGALAKNIYWVSNSDISIDSAFSGKISGIFLARKKIILDGSNGIVGYLYSQEDSIQFASSVSITIPDFSDGDGGGGGGGGGGGNTDVKNWFLSFLIIYVIILFFV
jgi:hypothetical protein